MVLIEFPKFTEEAVRYIPILNFEKIVLHLMLIYSIPMCFIIMDVSEDVYRNLQPVGPY